MGKSSDQASISFDVYFKLSLHYKGLSLHSWSRKTPFLCIYMSVSHEGCVILGEYRRIQDLAVNSIIFKILYKYITIGYEWDFPVNFSLVNL
jgi:hypothetical protein